MGFLKFFLSLFTFHYSVLSLFRNYLLLDKDETLYLDKLESSLAKDALCFVEISPVVLEKMKM